jgi:membrane protein DedA with SNARE-associated domain
VYTVIGVLAGVENVFPPVPADTAVALGAFLSNAGTVSATSVFLITWSANVTTAASVYLAGRSLGRSFFTGRLGRRLLDRPRLERLERLYRDHGSWGIFVSRFIPGVRAVVPPFAGVAGLGAWRAIAPMAVASAIWYGVLTYVAATVARSLDDLLRLVGRLNWTVAAIALVAVAAAVSGMLVGRRRRRARLQDQERGQG